MDLIIFMMLLAIRGANSQFFEDRRCRCVCPVPASVVNTTVTRQIFTGNVPPSQCNCEGVVYPLLKKELEGKLHIFCPRCECVYQTRNTTLIMERKNGVRVPFVIKRVYGRICRYVRIIARNLRRLQAVVFLTLTCLTMAILYMASLSWLKALVGRNNRRNDRSRSQQSERPAARQLERLNDFDHVREYRGEYERKRREFRDISPDSDEEELLMYAEDS